MGTRPLHVPIVLAARIPLPGRPPGGLIHREATDTGVPTVLVPSVAAMYLTTRESALLLAGRFKLSHGDALQALHAGLAGTPVPLGAALLYREEAVEELLAWPQLTGADLDHDSPFIARATDRRLRQATTWQARGDVLARGWYIPPLLRVWIRTRTTPPLRYPFLGTVAGFVVFGAEITDMTYGAEEERPMRREPQTVFGFEPPGEWFARFERHRLPTGPGHPWILWGAPSGRTSRMAAA